MISSEFRQLLIKPLAELTIAETRAWEALVAAHAYCRKAFLSPVFAACVAKSNPQVFVIIGYIDGVPVWFLPIQRHTGWLGRFGVFEPLGGVMSDYFGAVAKPGAKFSPREIFEVPNGRFAASLFTHLDESQVNCGLTGIDPRVGLRTRIGDSVEDYWEDLRKKDKKLVYDTERREKKLIKEHGEIRFEWQSTDREKDLSSLIEKKRDQYARTEKFHAPLFLPANVALLEGLLTTASPSCEGVLSVLYCAQDLVAAHFGLRCHETLHVWFPVYDPKYAAYSPGRILLKNIINESAKRKIHILDRGEGDNQAKRDFSNEQHTYYRGFWIANSPRGYMAKVAAAIYWRI